MVAIHEKICMPVGTAIIIDQLTFVEISKGSERKVRHEQVRDMLHDAKAAITSGTPISLEIMHQINREGVKAAEKTGHLQMYHLAEAAEVERTADHVIGLWSGPALRDAGLAWVQTLASRRCDIVHWEINWRPWIGGIRVRQQIELPD